MSVKLGLSHTKGEHILRVFKNTMLREYLDQRGRKWWEAGDGIMKSFTKYY
jgi:hypothetical protein